MNSWPPLPGSTVITVTKSTYFKYLEYSLNFEEGLIAIPALMFNDLIFLMHDKVSLNDKGSN